MSNRTFDFLRALSEQILPAVSALWLTISRIWHIQYGMEIALTISAVAVCIGTIIGIKRTLYNAVEMDEPETVMIPENYEEDEDNGDSSASA